MAKTIEKTKNSIVDPKVDSAVREKLVVARIGLLMKQPFFGNMATRLELTNADDWCPTAATDGRKFYYNTEFVNKLSQAETEFLFGHEVLHVCYDHMDRFGDRNKMIANIAADYVVNDDLVQQGVGKLITSTAVLHDVKYRGWSFEQVYEDLIKNAKKISIDDLAKMILDQHMDGSGTDEEGNENGSPKFSKEELESIKDEIREAMLSAAESVGAGNCPAGIQRIIKELTEPKMNWRELIQQQVESCAKVNYSWMRMNRKGWHCDAILPGFIPGTSIDIAIAIDNSGSISDVMLKDFMSEIKGIMEAFDDFKLTVWCFDTEVHNMQVFTTDTADDLMTYEIKGGGGTSFQANWDYMKENDIQPKKLIFFTDGESCDGWGEEDYCDVVWIIHNRHNKGIVPPYGLTANYE